MKNKDKYDLREIDASVLWTINGCGKKTSPRTIEIRYKNKKIAKIKNDDDPFIEILLGWLEEEN